MYMKKKYICLVFSLIFFCISLLQAQTNKQYDRYCIVNKELDRAIGEVVDSALKCPYFSVLKTPFLIKIVFYGQDFIGITVMPYSVTRNALSFLNTNINHFIAAGRIGNYFFYAINRGDETDFNDYFEKTKTKIRFPDEKSFNLVDQHIVLYNHITIYYDIEDQKLVQSPEDMELCHNKCMFAYLAKRNDSWKSISRKSHCSEQLLREAYPKMKKPIDGFLIDFQYIFKDDELIGIVPSL